MNVKVKKKKNENEKKKFSAIKYISFKFKRKKKICHRKIDIIHFETFKKLITIDIRKKNHNANKLSTQLKCSFLMHFDVGKSVISFKKGFILKYDT